jgi:transposase
MQIDLQNLPTDTALLHRLVCDIAATIEHRDSEIDRLESIIKQLQRAQFGRRSERLDPDQLALGLEDLDGDLARAHESGPRVQNRQSERTSHRKPLPDHLPRDEVRLDIDDMTCACCGGALHVIGESVSETLDWVPAQLRVIRTTRPKYACRSCATMAQARLRNG